MKAKPYIYPASTQYTDMGKIKEFVTPRGKFELHGVRGIVTNAGKTSTTRVVGGGGSSSVSSFSTINDQIFIVDKAGQEHVIQLKNWDFPAKNDQDISAYWLTKNGAVFAFYQDEYVHVYNHTLNKGLFKTNKQLKQVFRGGLGCLIPLAAIGFLSFLIWYMPFFSLLFPKQKATSTISFDGTYTDNRVQVERSNEIASAETVVAQAVAIVVIAITILVVYNVITNRKINHGIAELKQAIKQSAYYQ